jgi:long-chain acyl-CoA synthetase
MPSVHWPIIKSLLSAPFRVRVTDDQRSWRGIELLAASQHIAAEVARLSQTRTVGMMLPSGGAFPAAALAAWTLGRVCVPLNFLLRKDELQYVIDDCGTDVIVTASPMLEHLGFVPERVKLILLDKLNFKSPPEPRWPKRAETDDLAVLIYTSGTSGRPKGVMLSHGNISANISQYRRAVSITTDDVMLGILPGFHSFGFTVLTMAPLTIGCRVVYSARFMPPRVLKLIREHKATIFVAIPSMYNALLGVKDAKPADLASMRLAVSGGEPLPMDVATRFFERFGVRINEGYGLTETAPATNVCLPHEYRPHSVGRPLPDVCERIVSIETGRTLGPNEDGEVRMKGPNVMQGYYKLPAETAAAFDEDGWFRTGDIGRFDSDGHLFITGRLKEMMIVGGENVFPREIEEALNKHPDVHASAVVGLNDPVRGEVPIAFVELQEGAAFSEPALRTWCRDHLAGYKVPRDIRHIEALPRNPTGKIMRRDLKKLL